MGGVTILCWRMRAGGRSRVGEWWRRVVGWWTGEVMEEEEWEGGEEGGEMPAGREGEREGGRAHLMSSWFTLLAGGGGMRGGVEEGMEGGRGEVFSWAGVEEQIEPTEGGNEGGKGGGRGKRDEDEWKKRERVLDEGASLSKIGGGGEGEGGEGGGEGGGGGGGGGGKEEEGGGAGGYDASLPPSFLHLTSQRQEQLQRKESPSHLTCRIFATSLNCGSCTRVQALGCLKEWIPKGAFPPSLPPSHPPSLYG